MGEASLASQVGAQRGACILQAFAEEDAKGMMLLAADPGCITGHPYITQLKRISRYRCG